MLIHVEASCLFVDLCLSPMLPLLNSEGSQFGCVSMVTWEIFLYLLMMVMEENHYSCVVIDFRE